MPMEIQLIQSSILTLTHGQHQLMVVVPNLT
jgi:hypothetical protein